MAPTVGKYICIEDNNIPYGYKSGIYYIEWLNRTFE